MRRGSYGTGNSARYKALFYKEGTDPYEMFSWVERDSKIDNPVTGKIAFEQKSVEFPDTWSLNAINIVSQKYFSGTPGTKDREASLKTLINRVADTITRHGEQEGYFDDKNKLKHSMPSLNTYLPHNEPPSTALFGLILALKNVLSKQAPVLFWQLMTPCLQF